MSALPDPRAVMAAHSTVSARIRALAAAGYSRSQIKDLVDRSYQQVRQVLVDEEKRRARQGSGAATIQPGVREDSAAFGQLPAVGRLNSQRLELDAAGRLTLPPALLKTLGVQPGEVLIALSDDAGEVTLISPRTGMLRAQAIMRPFSRPGILASDELIAERRAEAARENRDG